MSNISEHYDRQYASGHYTVRDPRADLLDDYHVGLVSTMLGFRSAPQYRRVLDLGSGVGHYVRAWRRAGHAAWGCDISPVAVAMAADRTIAVGDAIGHLSTCASDGFDLVFSSMLLEHIERADVVRLLQESLRVAPISAHFVAHERGSDPGHINVMSPAEWAEWLCAATGYSVVLPNPLFPKVPLLAAFRSEADVPAILLAAYAA